MIDDINLLWQGEYMSVPFAEVFLLKSIFLCKTFAFEKDLIAAYERKKKIENRKHHEHDTGHTIPLNINNYWRRNRLLFLPFACQQIQLFTILTIHLRLTTDCKISYVIV